MSAVPLPQIAVTGLFQVGKSTLINALLGRYAAAEGQGLRTSRMAASYRFGEAEWAAGLTPAADSFETSINEFMEPDEDSPWMEAQPAADIFVHSPLLRDVVLVDTPGLDFSHEDNEIALAATERIDAVILLVTKQLPAENRAVCDFVKRALSGKPYGVVLNCGKDGPHLEDAGSLAAARVETAVLLALESMGLPPPRFTHRINLGLLSTRTRRSRKQSASDLLATTGLTHLRDKLRLLGGTGVAERRLTEQHSRVSQALAALRTASRTVNWHP